MLQQAHLRVNSDLDVLNQVLKWFEQFWVKYLAKRIWPENQLYRLQLALAEGFTNAVRHAHQGLPPETPIDLEIVLWEDRLEIRIWDKGKPFDPDTLEEPKPGELREAGGYGWFLLRRLADRVVYERYEDSRNCLLIIKQLSGIPKT